MLADFNWLACWIYRRHHEQWTRQMEQDAAAGKLDSLFEEAEAERSSDQFQDWPPAQRNTTN